MRQIYKLFIPVPQEVLDAYKIDHLEFGRDYIIPKPLDPRLIKYVPTAVSKAAIESGVAHIDHAQFKRR